ncbi:hypothetical protein AB0N09_30035 [Streptomyces erythrochromogenes]
MRPAVRGGPRRVLDVRRTVFRTVTDSTDEARRAWLRQARQEAAALVA